MSKPRWHELKTLPEYFCYILSGSKPFEIRKDDRGFYVGDYLLLREYDSKTNEYTGRICSREITYIFRDEEYGLKSGYVVMGLKHV